MRVLTSSTIWPLTWLLYDLFPRLKALRCTVPAVMLKSGTIVCPMKVGFAWLLLSQTSTLAYRKLLLKSNSKLRRVKRAA